MTGDIAHTFTHLLAVARQAVPIALVVIVSAALLVAYAAEMARRRRP